MRFDGRMGYGYGWRGHGPLLRDRGLLGFSGGLNLVENACNRRERMVGRVALSHDLGLRNEFCFRNRCPTSARCIFSVPVRPLFVKSWHFCGDRYAQTGGNLLFQGRACSSCPAKRNSVASSPNLAENIMPSGNPALFHASGTDIAGWPDMLNMEVPGI